MKCYRREIQSGRMLEIIDSCSPPPKRPRGKKMNKSSDAQQKRNIFNSQRRLERLLNANFGPRDLHIVLTYGGTPPSPDEAKKDLAKYTRRLRECCKKNSITLKWIAVTEYREGSRIHHHLIISGVNAETARLMWETEPDPAHRGKHREWAGHGHVRCGFLYGDDYEWLANYVSKESKPGERRWTSSQNLKKPEIGPLQEISFRELIRTRNNPTAPEGYRLVKWDFRVGIEGYPVMYRKCIKLSERTLRKKLRHSHMDRNIRTERYTSEWLSAPP